MSIWRYMFDNEWIQRADIEDLKRSERTSARGQRRRNVAANNRIQELEDEVGELMLLCRALLTTLRESGHVDPARFQDAMEKIDASDGVVDGKLSTEPDQSDQSGRPGPSAPVRRRRHT